MTVVVLLAALGLLPANERELAASPAEVLAALVDARQPLARWQLAPGRDGSGTHVRFVVEGEVPRARTLLALAFALDLQRRFDGVTARLDERRAKKSGFNMSGARPGRMRNCPSAVAGARTVVAEVPGGVELTITAADAGARAEIRRRAAHQVETSELGLRGDGGEHGGVGNGGGRFGFCPGIAPETSLSSVDVAAGVRLRVRAYRAASVPVLRRVTHERADAIAGSS